MDCCVNSKSMQHCPVEFNISISIGECRVMQEGQAFMQVYMHLCKIPCYNTSSLFVVAHRISPPFCLCSSIGAFSMLPLLKNAEKIMEGSIHMSVAEATLPHHC